MHRILLLLVTLLSLNAAYSQNREDTYQLLWKIEGKGLDESSYLFGTMHVNDERAFAFSDSVLIAFQAADILALEVSSDDYLKYAIANREKSNSNKFMKEIGSENYNTLRQKILEDSKIDIDLLENANPLLIERLLNRRHMNSDEKRNLDLDNYLFYSAKRLGKPIVGLEEINAGIRSAKGFDSELEREYFINRYVEKKDSLADFDMDKFLKEFMNSTFNHMMEEYYAGDIETLVSLFNNNEMEKFDMIRRNQNMAKNLDSLMQTSSVFCAIGAGHLGGEMGMVDILRNMGYQLTPVQARFTGVAEKLQKEIESAPGFRFEDVAEGFSVQMSGRPVDIKIPATNITGFVYQDLSKNAVEMLMTVDYAQIFIDKEAVIDVMVENFKEQQKFDIIANEKITLGAIAGRELTLGMDDNEVGKLRYFLKNGKAYVFFFWKVDLQGNMPKTIPFFESIEIFDITDFKNLRWNLTEKKKYDIKMMLPQVFAEYTQEIPMDDKANTMMKNYIISIVDKKHPFSASFQHLYYPPSYEIPTNEALKELFVEIAKDEYNATPISDSTYHRGEYKVNVTNYLMQDTVTISETYFARGNYVYYWMAQYVGKPSQEISAFLYDWEMLPWEKPEFEKYTAEDFSLLMGTEIEVDGENMYDEMIDSLTVYSSFDPNSGTTVRVYQYDFSEFAHFHSADSLTAQFNFEDTSRRVIFKQDTIDNGSYGYTTTIYRDSSYNLNEYDRLFWHGNKVFFLEIASPFDLDTQFANDVLESFEVKNQKDFNFFESKLDTILTLAKGNDTLSFNSIKGILEDYPLYPEDAQKLRKTINSGLPLDTDTWNSPGGDIIKAVAKLEGENAIGFLDSVFRKSAIYESAVLASLQEINTEKSIAYYRKLLANKTTTITYSNLNAYRDSVDLLLSDLSQVMNLYQNPDNQNVISSLFMSHATKENNLAKAIQPYASQFLESFKSTTDTLDLEDEYNWDSYFLGNLFDLSMLAGNKPKLMMAEFKKLLEAENPTLRMIGLLGMLHTGEPVQRKLIQEVLKYEEYGDFLLERLEKTGNQDQVSKYLDMEAIARIYLKSYLAYEDYYDVETTFIEQFEQEINGTTYTFYVFSYSDSYTEEDLVGFASFQKKKKGLSFKSVYTDIYMGTYIPEDFKAKKEEVVSDFKTYYIEVKE